MLDNKYRIQDTVELLAAIENTKLELEAAFMSGADLKTLYEIAERVRNLYACINTREITGLIKRAA